MVEIAKAIKFAPEAMGYSELHDYQRKTLKTYLLGRDVFVSAPTEALGHNAKILLMFCYCTVAALERRCFYTYFCGVRVSKRA